MFRNRVFQAWFFALAVLWVAANTPREYGGALTPFWHTAGFPWEYAHWSYGVKDESSMDAFIADIGLGVIVVSSLAWVCARSRRSIESTEVAPYATECLLCTE